MCRSSVFLLSLHTQPSCSSNTYYYKCSEVLDRNKKILWWIYKLWEKERQQGIDAVNCLLAVSNTVKSTLILLVAIQTSSACIVVAVIQGYLSMLKDFFLAKIMADTLIQQQGKMHVVLLEENYHWVKIKNLYLTNIFLNFHDEILLWSTTGEGKSHILPSLYIEFRSDDIFHADSTAWWKTRFQFNHNCGVVRFMKSNCKGN